MQSQLFKCLFGENCIRQVDTGVHKETDDHSDNSLRNKQRLHHLEKETNITNICPE